MKLGKELKSIKDVVKLEENNMYHTMAKNEAESSIDSLYHMLREAAESGFNNLKYTTTWIPKVNTISMRLIKEHFDKEDVDCKIYSYIDDWGLPNTGIEFNW